MESQRGYSDMDALAEAEGFAVLYGA